MREEIGAERSPEWVIPLGASPKPEKNLLDDVLGQPGVVGEPAGQTVNRAGVEPVCLGKRLVVARRELGPKPHVT